jgi:ankyrin repeat protein
MQVGDTLLHVAVTSNMPNILRTLLVEISLCIVDKDIVSSIVNKYNEDGLTPLHQAIKENKKVSCVKCLQLVYDNRNV